MIGTLSKDACKEMLSAGIIGRIGCHDGIRTYIVPVQYAFDGKDIYCHSVEGMKIHMMRKNPAVCFETDDIQTLNNWRSIILWGVYEELKGEYARYNAIKLFSDHFLQFKTSETALLPSLNNGAGTLNPKIRPVLFRIIIDELTGRFENPIHSNMEN